MILFTIVMIVLVSSMFRPRYYWRRPMYVHRPMYCFGSVFGRRPMRGNMHRHPMGRMRRF